MWKVGGVNKGEAERGGAFLGGRFTRGMSRDFHICRSSQSLSQEAKVTTVIRFKKRCLFQCLFGHE
jgi:hypothetical protein